MASNIYKSNVRIGNWYENQLAEEAHIIDKIKRDENVAAYQNGLSSYTQQAELSTSPDDLIHLGDKVIFNVPSTTLFKGGPLQKIGRVTMCVAPTRDAIVKDKSICGAFLTGSPNHIEPCYRNVFIIKPRLASQSENDVLCFGESFDMAYESPKGELLYVTSPPGTVIYSGRHSRRQEVLMEDFSSPYSAWKIEPLNNHDRESMVGKPVEVNETVGIFQMMTNQPLVVEEDFTMNTLFGQEPDVSVGVVNRATTRATAKFTILTWSKSNPQNPIEPPDIDQPTE